MPDPVRVLDALQNARLTDLNVALLPDVSVDLLLRFPRVEDALASIERAGDTGNANVHPDRQLIRPGGGAANAAHALARLGVQTHLVARTDATGLTFLEQSLAHLDMDLRHVQTDGRLHATVALECGDASIMLTPRDSEAFGPDRLTEADRNLLRTCDAVLVGDWSNPKAPDLAEEAWHLAKAGGAFTYTDTSDPPEDREGIATVLETLASPDLDAASLNAQELCTLIPDACADAGGLRRAGENLSSQVPCRIDLHSETLTASFLGGHTEATAPGFNVQARQATGAGDTWTAGNMLGDLLGLPADERLLLANALAALYVASDDARPATVETLAAFLRRPPLSVRRADG